MPADKEQLIQEILNAKVTPQRNWQPGNSATQSGNVSEMQSQITERDNRITVLETTVSEFQRREFERTVDGVVAEMTDWHVGDGAADATGKTPKEKLAALRAMFKRAILDKMGDNRDSQRVSEMAQAAWEEIKPIAEMMRDALAGPAAIVNGKVRESVLPKLEDTPENRARAASQMGIQV